MLQSPLALLLLFSLLAVNTVSGDCYENWSRCTPQTSLGTGILWKDCATYCSECKGRASGSCVPVQNKPCSGGYQCQCNGGNVPKSGNWAVKITCGLGL